MGYAVLRGDYSGRGGYSRMRGDPFSIGGLLSGIVKGGAKLLGKAAPVALSVFPGGGAAAKIAKGVGGKLFGVLRGASKSKAARVAAGIGGIAAGTYIGEKLAGASFGGGRVGGKRMNPANVKALRRAIRRMEGFQKLAKSTGCLPKAPRRSRPGVCRTCK